MSLGRLSGRLRELLRRMRGRKTARGIERLNPVLLGWAGYFKLSQSKSPLQVLHMNQALPKKLWDRLGLVSIHSMRMPRHPSTACNHLHMQRRRL